MTPAEAEALLARVAELEAERDWWRDRCLAPDVTGHTTLGRGRPPIAHPRAVRRGTRRYRRWTR